MGSLINVNAFSLDQGYLRSGQSKGGEYGVYKASFGNNQASTRAYWYNGGGGTVYVKMSVHPEVSKSGGQLQPGGNPTTVYDYGVVVQHHRYVGGPAY